MNIKLNRKTKRLIFSFLVLLLASAFGINQINPDNIISETIARTQPANYQVVEVYDGDTIGVNMSGKTEKIRLIGVDTPETHHPSKPVQCFGESASDFTKTNLLDKIVRLEADALSDNRDRYDRLLRYVYLTDDTLWNLKLVNDGYGFAYTSFPFTKMDQFKNAQTEAREKNRGLWAGCKIESSQYGTPTSGVAK